MEIYKLAVFSLLGFAVCYYDLRDRIIPDRLNLAGLIMAMPFYKENIVWFLAAGGVMFFLAVVSNNAVGGGDIKYAAVMGMYLGINAFPALAAAFLICGIVVIALLVLSILKLKDSIPFGPFLFIGGLLILIGGALQWSAILWIG